MAAAVILRNPVGIGAFVVASVVGVETSFRVRAPESAWRPSTAISRAATWVAAWAYWLGRQLGRFTDVYRFVKEVIGQDVANLLGAGARLFAAAFSFVNGYADYYRDSVTPLRVGILLFTAPLCYAGYTYGDLESIPPLVAAFDSLDPRTRGATKALATCAWTGFFATVVWRCAGSPKDISPASGLPAASDVDVVLSSDDDDDDDDDDGKIIRGRRALRSRGRGGAET